MLFRSGLFAFDAVTSDMAIVAQAIRNGAVVRFARINLFDHIISKRSNSLTMRNEIVAERERLMEKYCSRIFFLKRRLKKNLFLRFLGVFWVAALASHFSSLAREEGFMKAVKRIARRTRKQEKKHHNTPQPIWDGGFS